MSKIESALMNLGRLDRIARTDSPIHRLDPRAKLITALVFIVTVVSFDRYAVAGLIPFFLYPAVMVGRARIPAGYLFRRILIAAPFAVAVGMFNPLLDHRILLHIGSVPVSGGWISFVSILLRVILTVAAALILIATSGLYSVCGAMRSLGAPNVFTVQILFLYRYLFVLAEETLRTLRARSLRDFRHRHVGIRLFGVLVGHLFLRTLDRAQRIHAAMLSRGFAGEIRMDRAAAGPGWRDLTFSGGWIVLFIGFRTLDISGWMGRTAARFLG